MRVGAFSQGSLDGWEAERFNGETRYRLVDQDGRKVLHAQCQAAASGLFRRRRIDVSATPVLNWSWRVDQTFSGIDETTRAGDDYPARIYVVVSGGLLPWRTRALNYVWASGKPEGADWPNAHVSQAHMLAVRSGAPQRRGEWVTHSRNVVEDLRRFHGNKTDRIDAIALMTDCDDTGGAAEAWYGDIWFSAE